MSATGRSDVRHPLDAYQTPTWAIEAVLDATGPWKGRTVLEPCAGDGNIARALASKGAIVTSSDIQWGVDFLDAEFTRYHWVVTNPPYVHAQAFATKAFSLADGVIMLLRLGFLAGQKRHLWWQQHPPVGIYILSRRPSFTGKGTDSADYAWIMWRRGREMSGPGRTTVRWL